MREPRGSAAVELALVLPLALVAALALVQVGMLTRDALVVAGAAREGAREAAVSIDQARVEEAALRGGGGLAASRTEVAIERSGDVGDPVTVTVTYRAPVLVPFVEWLFPAEVVVASAATMRQETDGSDP
ncbi:MAG TPA: TadE/TadG family type IV pilus assembly protein [Actinomycetota bacterium]|nr:TadE/TadG family type IV pilus assembly protein [Actinomycetota bacterium]